MSKILFDKDVSLSPLRRKTIGVIGYGKPRGKHRR